MKVYRLAPHLQNGFTYGVLGDDAVSETSLAECYDQHGKKNGEEYEGWKVKSHNYWDGSNWRSLVVGSDDIGDMEPVEDETAAKIIKAVKAAKETAPYWDGVDHVYKYNGVEVYRTRWAADPFIARVEL